MSEPNQFKPLSTAVALAVLHGHKTEIRRIRKGSRVLQIGAVTWLRESWCVRPDFDDLHVRDIPNTAKVRYGKSHMSTTPLGIQRLGNAMPQWASRLNIQIVERRIELLRNITEESCIAEGCVGYAGWETPRQGFTHHWEQQHGSGSWMLNPEVYVYVFRLLPKETPNV